MNPVGQEQGGQGGAGSGGQNNGNGQQITTTISRQQQQQTSTTISNPFAQTTTTQFPTSTSSSSSSSGTRLTAIISGAIGGIAGLLLIALLVIFLLNRRHRRHIAKKCDSAEPVTYSSLNSAFSGVPFCHSPRTSQHDSLLPPQAVLTPSTAPNFPHGVGIRGGEAHHDVERDNWDYFLPTNAESQAGMSLGGALSLGRLNTSHQGPEPEATISPMSVRRPGDTPVTPSSGISPQTPGGDIPLMMPVMPQHTRDTMAFPVGASDVGVQRISTPGMPIVAPIPRYPLAHQDSLERDIRQGMVNTTPKLQDVSLLGPGRGSVGRGLSQELMRESPVLGQMNPVRMQILQGAPLPGNLAGQGGIQRFQSQRTVSSVSSMGISVVSDTELERLGVGSRGMHLS